MHVGALGGFGAAQVDHDQLAKWILGDFLEDVPRGESRAIAGVRADHEQVVGVLDVLGRMARLIAEQPAIDPKAAGLS